MSGGDQVAEPTERQIMDALAAYEAYGQTTGGLNFRGEPMPGWGGLGDTIQRAWIAAAAAVRATTEREVLRHLVSRVAPDGRPIAGRLAWAIGDRRRELLCEWLRANGVDPEDVPAGAGFEIRDGQLLVEVVHRENGGAVVTDEGFDAVVRMTRVVPLLAPFPDLDA